MIHPEGKAHVSGAVASGAYPAHVGQDQGPAPANRSSRVSQRAVGTLLFLVSYTPLWFIFSVLSTSRPQLAFFLALTGLGAGAALWVVNSGHRRSPRNMSFDTVSDKSGEVAGYLATYLLPFIQGPPATWQQAAGYFLYLVVAWAIFVSSDLGLVNPTLYVFGWRVVEVRGQGGRALVVTNHPMQPGAVYRLSSLMGNAGYVLREPSAPSLVDEVPE